MSLGGRWARLYIVLNMKFLVCVGFHIQLFSFSSSSSYRMGPVVVRHSVEGARSTLPNPKCGL